MSAKLLILDLERIPMWTKPLAAWDLKSLQYRRLSPDDIETWGRTICFGYRWGVKGRIEFAAEWHPGGRGAYLAKAQELLEEADILSGHNSQEFDHKHLAGDLFLEKGVALPKIKHIDTLKLARQNANWEANHLATLTTRLGIPSKNDKYRIEVAMAAVNGDVKAQKRIERYCRGDVRASSGMLEKFLPLSGVNLGLYEEDPTRPICTACGSKKIQRRGVAVKQALRYPRWMCTSCGKWMTSKTALPGGSVEMRPL